MRIAMTMEMFYGRVSLGKKLIRWIRGTTFGPVGLASLYCEIAVTKNQKTARSQDDGKLTTTHDKSRVGLGSRQSHLEDLSSNIVEENIDQILRRLLELGTEVRILVVKRTVTTKLLQPLDLVIASRKTQDLGPLQLRNLAHDTSGSSSRARDDDEVASLDLSDVNQPEIRRQACHAENTQRIRNLSASRDLKEREFLLLGDSLLGPAGGAGDVVALGELFRLGGQHLRNHGAAHLLADLHRRDIRPRVCEGMSEAWSKLWVVT